MPRLNAAARELIASGALAHLVTLNPDGSPQVSVIWVGLDGDELVSGHLDPGQRKMRNMARDPRVALSFEASAVNGIGLRENLILHARVRLTEAGAPELLSRLAQTYVGPGTVFPPFPDPPPGLIAHYTITKITGVGDWAAAELPPGDAGGPAPSASGTEPDR
jgi:PPOX class probable F420-dependent enzyme